MQYSKVKYSTFGVQYNDEDAVRSYHCNQNTNNKDDYREFILIIYLDPLVYSSLYKADGGIVGHCVEIILPTSVHAGRYVPVHIKGTLVYNWENI